MKGLPVLPALSSLLLLLVLSVGCTAYSRAGEVVVVRVEGVITPATRELVQEVYDYGLGLGAQAMLILLDTPGGQLDATLGIVEVMERSEIPWIVYVYPEGAKAWSAGAFILVASHVAAMAPHTLVGSAQPASYNPVQGSTPVEDEKTVNALSAFIAERARMHDRNGTAAELFVRENLNLNAGDALERRVIDVVASGVRELLEAVDGRSVKTSMGLKTLETRDATVTEYSPGVRVRLLSAISDPLLAYILFTLGLYALIFGLLTPGYGAEVAGGIALILGLMGLGFNINLASLFLIGLGIVLLLAEVHTPGFGALGGMGIACLTIGGLLLIPSGGAGWLISPGWYRRLMILSLLSAGSIGGFTLFAAYKALKARRMRPLIGEIIGEVAEAAEDLTPGATGFVRYKGEYWRARPRTPIKAGSKARIIGKDGPTLIVEGLEQE
ncbi:nodulation protein NfeD [Candidatus Bathyarchaeota archaeon]|nr:nodulation protein NfeD [Candidatus Bathyarchaeota archaeon]